MAFDPDAYLAAKAPQAVQPVGFDPDAYLASKQQQTPSPAVSPGGNAPLAQQDSPSPDGLTQTIDALQGFRDIPNAVRQGLARVPNEALELAANIPGVGGVVRAAQMIRPESPEAIDAELAAQEQAYQQRRAAEGETGMDLSRIAGNIVATAPLAAAAPVSAGAGLGVRTAQAMGQGALVSAAQPVVNGENFAAEKAKQVGIGMAAAGVLTPFMSFAASAVKPAVSQAVDKLNRAGVKMTPGSLANARGTEAKLTSTPFVGDKIRESARKSIESFNKAAYNEALAPIGAKAPASAGHEGISAVRKTISDAYDDVLSKAKFIPDDQFRSELSSLRGLANELSPKEKGRFLQEIAKIESKQSPIGGMAGETYKIVESRLLREAKKFSASPDPYQKELGGAMGELLATYKRGLSRSNPDYAARLAQVNESWANYARLRRAASSLGADDGVFTPEQLLNAVKAEDKTVGKRAFSEGQALMQELASAGKKVIGKGYPDSGTAGREAVWNPIALGAGAALSPIYSAAEKLAPSLLLNRPSGAQELSNMLLRASPAVSVAGAAAGNQLIGNR